MNQAFKADPGEFPEGKREKPEVGELPPSSDKGFWGKDADITLIDKKALRALNKGPHGDFIQRGQDVICQACEAPHTIPGVTLDHKGKLIPLDKPQTVSPK